MELPRVVQRYNAKRHGTTGYSPWELFKNRPLNWETRDIREQQVNVRETLEGDVSHQIVNTTISAQSRLELHNAYIDNVEQMVEARKKVKLKAINSTAKRQSINTAPSSMDIHAPIVAPKSTVWFNRKSLGSFFSKLSKGQKARYPQTLKGRIEQYFIGSTKYKIHYDTPDKKKMKLYLYRKEFVTNATEKDNNKQSHQSRHRFKDKKDFFVTLHDFFAKESQKWNRNKAYKAKYKYNKKEGLGKKSSAEKKQYVDSILKKRNISIPNALSESDWLLSLSFQV